MSNQLAIIGAGSIGSLHAESAAAAGLPLALVCDVDATKAEKLAGRWPVVQVATSINEVLARDDIAAVVIAVPNRLHAELAIPALTAGKAVLLEKPMAITIPECRSILDTAGRAATPLQLGFVCRYAPAVQSARDLIAAGTLGTIYQIKATLHRQRGIPGLGRWFTTKSESGGGVLIDIGVHLVDLALLLAGYPEPKRVSAVCHSRFGSPISSYRYEEMWAGPPNPDGVFNVEDGASGLIRCANDLTVEISVTWAANMPDGYCRDGLLVLGDKGGCFVDIWADTLTVTDERSGALADHEILLDTGDDPWTDTWHAQHRAFRSIVEDGTPPTATGEHGLIVQAVIDAMYRSSDEQRETDVRL